MEDAYEVLSEFGLTHNEVKTYLAALSLGGSTASEISAKTGIHRINIYDILNKLQQKGIITQTLIGNNKYYEAIHPKEFKTIIEQRKKDLESILPSLTKQMGLAKNPLDATIIKSKKGIKNILQEFTNSKTGICHFASENYLFGKVFPEYHEVWPQRLYEKGVHFRSLQNPKQRTQIQHEVYNRRFYPENFNFPSTTVISDDHVLIIIWEQGPTGILIKNQAVANSYRNFFEMIWKISKE